MTVVHASVFVDALVSSGLPGERARHELRGLAVLEVPAIFGAEVTSALRMLVMRDELSPSVWREQPVHVAASVSPEARPSLHWRLR